jgi:hypothetical protein
VIHVADSMLLTEEGFLVALTHERIEYNATLAALKARGDKAWTGRR